MHDLSSAMNHGDQKIFQLRVHCLPSGAAYACPIVRESDTKRQVSYIILRVQSKIDVPYEIDQQFKLIIIIITSEEGRSYEQLREYTS